MAEADDQNDDMDRRLRMAEASARSPEQKLHHAVVTLTEEVRNLRRDLHQRPTRAEVNTQRRLAIVRVGVVVFWGLIITVTASDAHIQSCSPGARASRVVDQILEGNVTDIGGLREAANEPRPDHCDIMFPLHSHDHGDPWPNDGNWIGVGLFSLATAISVFLVRTRSWESKGEEPNRRWDDKPKPKST